MKTNLQAISNRKQSREGAARTRFFLLASSVRLLVELVAVGACLSKARNTERADAVEQREALSIRRWYRARVEPGEDAADLESAFSSREPERVEMAFRLAKAFGLIEDGPERRELVMKKGAGSRGGSLDGAQRIETRQSVEQGSGGCDRLSATA